MHGNPRSWMFVPGNRPRFIDKGLREVAADTIFLDLEDGVPTAEKPAARKLVAAALAPPATRPLRYVRVNRVGSDWFREDMRCILVAGLDGICLPKVEQETDVLAVAEELHRFERESGLEPGHIGILAAIESARGLLAAPSIAACSPRVVGLILGPLSVATLTDYVFKRPAAVGWSLTIVVLVTGPVATVLLFRGLKYYRRALDEAEA